MPFYEFACRDCSVRQTQFFRSVAAAVAPVCERCGSGELTRLMSRFAVARTTAQVHGSMAAGDMSDPRNIGRATEERAAQLGVALPGEVRSMIEAARDGTMPAAVTDL